MLREAWSDKSFPDALENFQRFLKNCQIVRMRLPFNTPVKRTLNQANEPNRFLPSTTQLTHL